MPEIRPAESSDVAAIEAVHRATFPTDLEARLVRLLVERGQDAVSLVAVEGGQIAGHVLFSPATIEADGRVFATGLGLAPIAVLPPFQSRGFGSALIRAGLDACRQLATGFVVVLGAPAYYARFAFVPASRHRLTCEFGGDDAFQIQWLRNNPAIPPGCFVRYAPEFREVFDASTDQHKIALSPDEQREFSQALQEPVRLTAAQQKLGAIMRGET
jgi:putative acetyltransferase